MGKLALLLNGAGAKGLCQAGMIQAFADHGVPYDVIYASSAGSLNGAIYHAGDLSLLRDIWLNIKTWNVYRWNPGNLFTLINKTSSIFDNKPLFETIKAYVNPAKIRANPRDLFIGATDQTTWEARLFDAHELTDVELCTILGASASVPVFFPSVKFRGHDYIDSGVINNYDILSAVDDGCDTLVIMGFAVPEPIVPHNVKDELGQVLSMMMHSQFAREMLAVEKLNEVLTNDIKVVKIIPDKPLGIGLLDFDYKSVDREEVWQKGYDLAREILKQEL